MSTPVPSQPIPMASPSATQAAESPPTPTLIWKKPKVKLPSRNSLDRPTTAPSGQPCQPLITTRIVIKRGPSAPALPVEQQSDRPSSSPSPRPRTGKVVVTTRSRSHSVLELPSKGILLNSASPRNGSPAITPREHSSSNPSSPAPVRTRSRADS